jgi:hypothetical protein
MRRFLAVALCALVVGTSTASAATILFDSGLELSEIDAGEPSHLRGGVSSGRGSQVAVYFALADRSRISSIEWTSYYNGPTRRFPGSSFMIEFRRPTSTGYPALKELNSNGFSSWQRGFSIVPLSTPAPDGLSQMYQYTLKLNPLYLDAGDYFLSIWSFDDWDFYGTWFWSATQSNRTLYRAPYGYPDPAQWYISGERVTDFTLTGRVPEPATLSLLASALAASLYRRSRQRRQ